MSEPETTSKLLMEPSLKVVRILWCGWGHSKTRLFCDGSVAWHSVTEFLLV